MIKPNWFDTKYEHAMERSTAEQCLAELVKDQKIVKAVKDSLASHDANSKKPGFEGPSRTQSVRTAVCQALEAVS